MTTLPPENLLSPDAIRDPRGFFRRLREHDPVFWSERHKVWILISYQDVHRVFRNRSLLRCRRRCEAAGNSPSHFIEGVVG